MLPSLVIKHSINIQWGVVLPNDTLYGTSFLENEQIKKQIQKFLDKGYIHPWSLSIHHYICFEKKWHIENVRGHIKNLDYGVGILHLALSKVLSLNN